MSATRHDPYRLIHKALRLQLSDALVQIGRMDPDDAADVAHALAALEHLLDALDSHAFHENRFLHAAIEARIPGAAQQTEDEHRGHRDEFALLRELAETLTATPRGARGAIADQLYVELARIVAEQLLHMRVEEIDNNAALWSAYSDEELRGLHAELVASIPREETNRALALMMRALRHQERVQLLTGMRAGMDDAAFQNTVAGLFSLLPPLDQRKLAVGLSLSGASRTLAV